MYKRQAPPGTLFRAVALPIMDGRAFREGAIDLSSFVKDGALVWETPPGAWHVFVVTEDSLYDGTHAAVSLAYGDGNGGNAVAPSHDSNSGSNSRPDTR